MNLQVVGMRNGKSTSRNVVDRLEDHLIKTVMIILSDVLQ